MNVVLDCSASIRIVLRQEPASQLEAVLQRADLIWTPDLMFAEAANVLWKYHAHAGLPLATCEFALKYVRELVNRVAPSDELFVKTFQSACAARTPAYDMFYLALALREKATLLSVDGPLQRKARSHGVEIA